MTVKTVIMLQKISISNKYCSFELSVHQRILKKLWFPQKYETTVFKGIFHFFFGNRLI